MKTAEEVAKEILNKCWDRTEMTKPPSAKKIIAQALTAYRAEWVKEAEKEIDELSEPMSCGHAEAEMQPSDEGPDMCIACYLEQGEVEKARAEALEEAAKVAEGHAQWSGIALDASRQIAAAIRALKEKS